MTRADMIAAILAVKDGEYQNEVSYYVHDIGEREYAYDELSAAIDIEERSEQAIHDSDDQKIKHQYRRLLKVARQALIAIGYYRVMPQEEIEQTYVSFGTAWTFKLDQIAYTLNDDFAEEQFPPEQEEAEA